MKNRAKTNDAEFNKRVGRLAIRALTSLSGFRLPNCGQYGGAAPDKGFVFDISHLNDQLTNFCTAVVDEPP